jgi:hypothetical protein
MYGSWCAYQLQRLARNRKAGFTKIFGRDTLEYPAIILLCAETPLSPH